MYSKVTAAVGFLVRGTMSWPVVADHKLDRPVCDVTGVQYDATRYGGTMP